MEIELVMQAGTDVVLAACLFVKVASQPNGLVHPASPQPPSPHSYIHLHLIAKSFNLLCVFVIFCLIFFTMN